MKHLLTALVLSFLPTQASAQQTRGPDWVPISASGDFTRFIRISDLNNRTNYNPEIWERAEHKDGFFFMNLKRFKCREQKIEYLSISQYDKDGRVIGQSNYDGEKVEFAPPGTALYAQMQAVCPKQ